MSQRLFWPSKLRPRHSICSSCRRLLVRRCFTTSPRQHLPHDDNLLAHLERRGLINQIAGDRNTLSRLLETRKRGVYAGIDPTASSLHLGHLLPLMVLFWTYIYGHRAVSLVGGATARVGDPSGRLTSRESTGRDVQRRNFEAMFAQVKGLWGSVGLSARRHDVKEKELGEFTVVDNSQWLEGLGVLEFLRTLGNGMRVGTMLGRETVRNKMEKGDGMSFSELTYPLLQGYDWWHMYSSMDVQIQVGGSDQYGNIIAGVDTVKYMAQIHEYGQQRPVWMGEGSRLREECAPMGLTVPLLTTTSGEKFGKSAGNAIWLDPSMTSPFDLYGFLLRTADADVERYLKIFTLVRLDTITQVMHEHTPDPGKRIAQHLLATEVLTLVHGDEIAARTRKEHSAMRDPSILKTSGNDENTIVIHASKIMGQTWARVLREAGLAKSNSEAARLIDGGGVFVASYSQSGDNEGGVEFQRLADPKEKVMESMLLDDRLLVRLGKWKVKVIQVVSDTQAEPLVDEVDK